MACFSVVAEPGMPRTERVISTGRVPFATKYSLHSLRRDLNLFISELWRGAPRKALRSDSKKPNALATPKLEPKDLQANQSGLGLIPKLEARDLQASQSLLGPSLLVKGEISGNEDLCIDCAVEGIVRLNERMLVIGPAANVKADITAGDVVIRGNLRGNVRAKGRIEIGNNGSVNGDLRTPQVFIEDGALFKGTIEIEKNIEKQSEKNVLSETKSPLANINVAAERKSISFTNRTESP